MPAGADPVALLRGEVTEVAPSLLGAQLRHGDVAVLITEVEAYAGADDAASHAFRGPTARTEVMFGPAGRLYVYRSHGLHWCANVVTGTEGSASAVLLRAGRVVDGAVIATARRGGVPEPRLARGPGCLCQALAVTGEHSGADLASGAVRLTVLPGALEPGEAVVSGPRVGVSRAADRPWRWWIAGESSVSDYRRSPRAGR